MHGDRYCSKRNDSARKFPVPSTHVLNGLCVLSPVRSSGHQRSSASGPRLPAPDLEPDFELHRSWLTRLVPQQLDVRIAAREMTD